MDYLHSISVANDTLQKLEKWAFTNNDRKLSYQFRLFRHNVIINLASNKRNNNFEKAMEELFVTATKEHMNYLLADINQA